MPATTPQRPRHWLRRLRNSAGIALLALLALLIVTIAINRTDEALEPATLAWLKYQSPTAADAQNGYLALLALDARAADPLAAAAAVLREERAIFAATRASQQQAGPHYADIRARLLQPAETRIPLDDCRDKCLDYILTHAEKMTQLASKHAGLLASYRAMLDFPAYAEDIPRDPRALYPNHGLAYSLGLLYLQSVVSAIQHGDAQAAYRAWAHHQRFWNMAAAGSVTLRDTMRAIAQLERNQALLSDLLKTYPNSIAMARQHALPLLAAEPQLASLVARSMVAEFQMQAYVLTDMLARSSLFVTADEAPADIRDRLALLFYQRNASLNLLQRLHQRDLSLNGLALAGDTPNPGMQDDAVCTRKPDMHILANPLGKMFLCREGAYDLSRYHAHAARVDARSGELQSAMQAKH